MRRHRVTLGLAGQARRQYLAVGKISESPGIKNSHSSILFYFLTHLLHRRMTLGKLFNLFESQFFHN